MEIQQGFNRIGVSVAIAFIGLSLVCLAIGGKNYLEYQHELAVAYPKFFGSTQRETSALALLNGPQDRIANWRRFQDLRFRPVDQALKLGVMCLLASIVSLLFWIAVGRIYVFVGARRRSASAGV